MKITPVRVGSRVYWHGMFPDPTLRGTVKATGLIRHVVLWDGAEETSMVTVSSVAKILSGKPVCPYAPDTCGYCA